MMNTYTPSSDKIIHETFVDFIERPIVSPVKLVEYDDTLPILAVKLYKNGSEYEIPTNANVNIRFNKSDATFVYNPALGCDSSKTIVYFSVTNQMTAVSGRSDPVVEVLINGNVASSGSFPVIIERNPVQTGDIESSEEAITIREYVREAKEAAENASSAASSALSSKNAAASSASSASSSASSALDSKNAAASSASSASNSASSALSAKTAAENAKTASETAKEAAETAKNNAQAYANQAQSALEEILGADIGEFGKQLAMGHSVVQVLQDSSGNPIQDSNDNNLEGATIFVDISDFIALQKKFSNMETIIRVLVKRIADVEKYAILDVQY